VRKKLPPGARPRIECQPFVRRMTVWRATCWVKAMKQSIRRATLALLLSGAAFMFGQTAKEDMKQAGQDVKEAGKATGEAAKNTGKATKRTAKTAGKKVKHGTHKAAAKVEEKTRDKQQ